MHCKFALTQEHLPVLFLLHLHFINSEHTPEASGSVIHREDNLDKHSLTDIYSFFYISDFFIILGGHLGFLTLLFIRSC